MRKTIHWLGGISALLLLSSTAFANPSVPNHPSAIVTMQSASGMMAKLTGNKTSPMRKMMHGASAKMKHGSMGMAASVTGPVKGRVSGKTFVIGQRSGSMTVDAAKATIRDNGKFASISSIKGGTMVTASGTMMGRMLMATKVMIHSRGGKMSAMKVHKKGPMTVKRMAPKKAK